MAHQTHQTHATITEAEQQEQLATSDWTDPHTRIEDHATMTPQQITRALSAKYRAKTGRQPSEDIRTTLWVHYLKRQNRAAERHAETGIEPDHRLTIWRAVSDTIRTIIQAELERERERDALDTYGTLKSYIGLIPAHAHHRTDTESDAIARIQDFESAIDLEDRSPRFTRPIAPLSAIH